MNLNITMGQYYPVDSFVHRLDPRTKILLTILMIVAVFMVHSLVGYALVLAFLYWAAKCSNVPFKMLMKGIKPLRIILILTFVLNLFFSNGTTPLIDWWIIHITREGLTQAVHYSLRLVFLVLATSLMTLTTSPIALSDGIELLLSPLKRFHFPAHELAMMMSIALRFIPTLMEEADKIMKAQMARGADFETGNLFARCEGDDSLRWCRCSSARSAARVNWQWRWKPAATTVARTAHACASWKSRKTTTLPLARCLR